MKEKLKDRRAVARYEMTNYDTIIFVLTDNKEYWIVIENSALIMHNIVHEQIDLQTRLTAYRDYILKRQAVRVAYHVNQIEDIKKDLLQIVGATLISDYEDEMTFKLKSPIDEEQLLEWRKSEEVKIAERDALLEPSIKDPELSRLVRDLGKEIILAIDSMRSPLRATFGNRFIDILLEIYDILCEEMIDKIRLFKIIKDFGFQISILADKDGVDYTRAKQIGVILQDMKKEINTEDAKRRAVKRKR
jgi:hypothetical protein